jgi:hypothetical protein
MAIVPVTPLGTGLTVGKAPTCKPFGPTGAPGTIPSEEVTPTEGVTIPTWAKAGLQHKKGNVVATINNARMGILRLMAEGLRGAPQAPLSKTATATRLVFMAVDTSRFR